MAQRPIDIALHGFRSRGFASEDLGLKVIYAVEGIVEGVQEEHRMALNRLKSLLPQTIRNTPHSCHTEEHCCSLHAAHRAAADKVEEIVQQEIDKLEGRYVRRDEKHGDTDCEGGNPEHGLFRGIHG